VELAYDLATAMAAAGWYSHWKTEEGSVFASFSDMHVVPAAAEEQKALHQNN
jgi:hypothetical protein